MKMCNKYLLAFALTGSVVSVTAQNVTYTTYNDKQSFMKHWKLTEEELERYDKYMDVEGKYRYPNLTPYEVLGITAKDDAQMQYYAKKAAINERKQVKQEMQFILLTTQYKKAFGDKERMNDPVFQKLKQKLEQKPTNETSNESLKNKLLISPTAKEQKSKEGN